MDRFWAELVEAVGPVHTMAEVRPACVVATRRFEAHLVEALRTRSLAIKVLPNIGTSKHPIRAIQLRAPIEHKLACFDPTHPQGKRSTAIVIDDHGRLKRVTASTDGTVRWDDVEDQELVAEDVTNFLAKTEYLMLRNQGPDELGRLAAAVLAVLDDVKQHLDA